jgi:hypothetical protein
VRGLRELTRLPSNGYDGSQIDWERLRQLARRTARDTKVARETHSVTVQKVGTREVRGGFLNLAKRTESYELPVVSPMTDDDVLLLDFEAKYYSSALTRLLTGRSS